MKILKRTQSGQISLIILGAMLIAGLAAAFFLTTDSIIKKVDCTSSSERPCYDKHTGQKTIGLNAKAGENAFEACTKNSSKNDQGTLTIKTGLYDQEQFSFCYEGQGKTFLRKFEGKSGTSPVATENPNCPDYQPVPYHQIRSASISGTADVSAYPADIEKFLKSINSNFWTYTLVRAKNGDLFAGGSDYKSGWYGSLAVIYKSGDNGKTWQLSNFPAKADGYSQSFNNIVEDSEGNFYATARGYGVVKSEDGGNNWKALPVSWQPNTEFPYGGTKTDRDFIRDIIVLKDDSIVIVLPFWWGYWHDSVYRSTDGGLTWNRLFSYPGAAIISVVEADDGSLIFSHGDDGVLKLSNNQLVSTLKVEGFWRPSTLLKTQNGTLYFTALEEKQNLAYPVSILYTSSDNGDSWRKIGDILGDNTWGGTDRLMEGSDGSLYAFASGTKCWAGTILKSSDRGRKWSVLSGSVPALSLYPSYYMLYDFVEAGGKILHAGNMGGIIFSNP